MANKKYSIKEGVTFRPYGIKSLVTDAQLTDEVAEIFLKKNPSLLGTVIVENKKAKAEPEPKKKKK